MSSYKLKSALISEFRQQLNGKSEKIRSIMDQPFFDIINRVCKRKPKDVKLHIDAVKNSLSFNIEFSKTLKIYIEYFTDRNPNTLITVTGEECKDFDSHNDLFCDNLSGALDFVDKLKI